MWIRTDKALPTDSRIIEVRYNNGIIEKARFNTHIYENKLKISFNDLDGCCIEGTQFGFKRIIEWKEVLIAVNSELDFAAAISQFVDFIPVVVSTEMKEKFHSAISSYFANLNQGGWSADIAPLKNGSKFIRTRK